MKVKTRRVGVAALALVVCLSITPVASAVHTKDASGVGSIRETITRILKKLKLFGGIAVLEDNPGPPKP